MSFNTVKIRRVRAALVLLIGLGLAACAAPPPPPEPGRVTIAPGITLALPSPAALGRSVDAVQIVTARHRGDSFVFEGRLSVEPERLLLVGTDSLGRRAMTVTWSQGQISVERAAWLPDSLRPENILADIVLLYWPEAAVRSGLSGADLTEQTGNRAIGSAILVSWQGDPWNGTAHLRNLVWEYELDVRSVLVGP
ncbi:DUF3261 domain-containing protein [Magnetospirillum fulvum]|uniref:DUF3261 domain-containing protein n=1 Tax=Magnetospirillum fulvum TaxID=1082 RepID=A0A1H6ISH5_MAGFU|nr:DUF3261 domain-containing protein [Magnetospirillum fulvum]SEH50012.1 Protein of unknown function [Magnetospirillum fulvum]